MDRLETEACEPECVLSGRMDRENTLHLRCRLETTHLAFSLPCVLPGCLSPVVFELPGSISSRQAEFPAGRQVASQLIAGQPP